MSCAISPSVASSKSARHSKAFSLLRSARPATPRVRIPVKSFSAHLMAYAGPNANAAFELANKLIRAKDPLEAFVLQSKYLKSKSQVAAVHAQAKELGAAIEKSLYPVSN